MSKFTSMAPLAEIVQESRQERSARAQREIALLRAEARQPPPWNDMRAFEVHRALYEPALQHLSTGWRPDPRRRVAKHWKKLYAQAQGGMLSVCYESDGSLTHPEQFAAEVGPFKVRWLTHPKAGQVEDIAPHLYLTLRQSDGRCHFAEPVPDDEPLCPPVLPTSMPSLFESARAIAGKALKKDPSEVSFAEAVKFFRARDEARAAEAAALAEAIK